MWEALGELGGRAWENMWEIKPAKRNEKHISWCEGKRTQSHDPTRSLKRFRHLLQRGESVFWRTSSIPNLTWLQEDIAGLFYDTFARRITVISLLGCKCHLQSQESGLSQIGLQVGLWRGQTFCAWCLFCQLAWLLTSLGLSFPNKASKGDIMKSFLGLKLCGVWGRKREPKHFLSRTGCQVLYIFMHSLFLSLLGFP